MSTHHLEQLHSHPHVARASKRQTCTLYLQLPKAWGFQTASIYFMFQQGSACRLGQGSGAGQSTPKVARSQDWEAGPGWGQDLGWAGLRGSSTHRASPGGQMEPPHGSAPQARNGSGQSFQHGPGHQHSVTGLPSAVEHTARPHTWPLIPLSPRLKS